MPATSKDDRTEAPSAKRKRKARKQGQVPKSPEIAAWLSVLVVTSLLPTFMRDATNRVTGVFTQVSQVMANPSAGSALAVFEVGLQQALYALLPIVGVIAGLSLIVNVAQTRFVFATSRLKPDWARLNPFAGIRQLFSPTTVWQLVKEVLKLAVVGLLAYQVIMAMMQRVVAAQPASLGAIVAYTGGVLDGLVRKVAIGGLLVAAGDYAFMRHRTNKQMKMTKQEVKDERRQDNGSPEIRQAVRRKQMTMNRHRMMAAVAGADVVITNPTHFAVALRYEPDRGQAPRVVAKGADAVALRIRDEAHRHGVPVVEDPPLARAVFAACELDATVPRELYEAVARLLAFVFTLPASLRSSGIVHHRPTSALSA